jgi:hypothetical protein
MPTIETPSEKHLNNKENEYSRNIILYRYYKRMLAPRWANKSRGLPTDIISVLVVQETPESNFD